MEPESLSPFDTAAGIPAPYGRACTNCYRAKCKCITRHVGGSCERCHRLNKTCRSSISTRKREKKKAPTSKTAQLEEKLDGIVSLLKNATQSTATQPTAMAADLSAVTPALGYEPNSFSWRNSTTSSHTQIEGGSTDTVSPDSYLNQPDHASGTASSPRTFPLRGSDTRDAFEPLGLEAEQYLTEFCTQNLKYFPFVYIPSTTTSEQLRQDRPFLWVCIMATTSKSTSQKQALDYQIRKILAQKLLLDSDRNIDLLLGLLAYIGWASHQMQNNQTQKKPTLSLFTQIVEALIYDLSLNKPIPQGAYATLCAQYHLIPKTSLPTSTVRTMEERRAVLGSFLITSVISCYLQKIDAMQWTPHFDECLQALSESRECPNDEILLEQVRLQLLVEKVTHSPWHGLMQNAESTRAPLSFYLQALQSQLKEIKNKLPLQSYGVEIMLLHLHNTEIIVHEIPLSRGPIFTITSDFQSLESLYICLNSIKSWFDVFFTIPPVAYIGFPFSIFSQLMHCLITLYRLSTFEDPAWDKSLVRKTADLLATMDQVIRNMEQVTPLSGLEGGTTGNSFTRGIKLFESLRNNWEAELRVEPTLPALATAPALTEIVPEAFSIDFSDDIWLTDIFGPRNL